MLETWQFINLNSGVYTYWEHSLIYVRLFGLYLDGMVTMWFEKLRVKELFLCALSSSQNVVFVCKPCHFKRWLTTLLTPHFTLTFSIFLVSLIILQALEHYTDLYDIKRAVVHTHLLNPEVRAHRIRSRSYLCFREAGCDAVSLALSLSNLCLHFKDGTTWKDNWIHGKIVVFMSSFKLYKENSVKCSTLMSMGNH